MLKGFRLGFELGATFASFAATLLLDDQLTELRRSSELTRVVKTPPKGAVHEPVEMGFGRVDFRRQLPRQPLLHQN